MILLLCMEMELVARGEREKQVCWENAWDKRIEQVESRWPRRVTAGEDICHPERRHWLEPAVTALCHFIYIMWQRQTRCLSGPWLFILYLYTCAPRKILPFGGGIYPLYRTRAVDVVSVGSQSGNGRPNLGSAEAAITIHFISSLLVRSYFRSFLSSALLSSSLMGLVHHLSSSYNSLLFSPLHLLSPSFFFSLLSCALLSFSLS